MKTLLLVPLGLMLVGVGLAAGLVVGDADDVEPLEEPGDVLVRTSDGDVRSYTAETAAARIESLEDMLRRRRQRVSVEESASAMAAPEFAARTAREPPLTHPEGRPYTADEVRALARGAGGPELQARAIRALRRVDSAEARTTLEALLDDPETSGDMRLLAAQVLVRPPHRDHMPEELIERLATEESEEVRHVLAQGVAGLRERGAWMREISGMLGDETDPEVRRALLGAVARTSRDPAARQELLAIASRPGAPPEERATALAALRRGRPDRDTVAAIRPLLDDADPAVRRQALRILSSDRSMPLSTLREGLGDQNPGVRATVLSQAMHHMRRFRSNEKIPKNAVNATARRAVELATSDPDASVRRAGVSAARYLPQKQRTAVLAAGREDDDLNVRLAAYANSPRNVAVKATPEILGALSSPERGTRDYAYWQLRRLHGVRVPFQGGWNDAARAAAIDEIRAAIGTAE